MITIQKVHHIAIICSDYKKSKEFYTQILGFQIENEIYRAERDSYKLDLSLDGNYLIELFSFPNPPARKTQPEATGLRHIAFSVENIDAAVKQLEASKIDVESIRIDPYTNKRFTFFYDPDNLPIELYESNE